jgi:hypothetical protein
LSVAAVDGKRALQLRRHVCSIYYYRHVSR